MRLDSTLCPSLVMAPQNTLLYYIANPESKNFVLIPSKDLLLLDYMDYSLLVKLFESCSFQMRLYIHDLTACFISNQHLANQTSGSPAPPDNDHIT